MWHNGATPKYLQGLVGLLHGNNYFDMNFCSWQLLNMSSCTCLSVDEVEREQEATKRALGFLNVRVIIQVQL